MGYKVKMHYYRLLFSLIFIYPLFFNIHAKVTPKREFRGAWIHVVEQGQYKNMQGEALKSYLTGILDKLHELNVNAVIFQVRPAADAFYESGLEPWSRYLTGVQGKQPQPFVDPLYFMVEECHKRNMELHAWLNPYRVTLRSDDVLHDSHLYHRYPERFVKYGSQLYFDPGLPENREHICRIVKDIVTRYDIDAIHMDDYFYPYPRAGEKFPDDKSFYRYGIPQGYTPEQRDDWRRNNVNVLIREIRHTITLAKPWVRFGISPFGIYRNKKSTPDGSGSNTNGLQNYDDLYADVKLWVEKGWIDYNIPQIYWEIGHKVADYATLIKWWNEHNYGKHLYIGQDVVRTVNGKDISDYSSNQLPAKMLLERSLAGVSGNCFWPAYEIINNKGGIADSLRNNYHRYPALIPAYTDLHAKQPQDVKSLKAKWTPEGYKLQWKKNGDPNHPETAQYFVVYRFGKKEKVNLNDPSKIAGITREPEYLLPYNKGKEKYKYVVTSVDRFHNESKKGKSKSIKL